MKIVVDTNIIFSVILNTNSAIGDIIFNSDEKFNFYSCAYMQYEIEKHWDKLKRLSKISDSALNEVRFKVYSKINFINEELIPEKIWLTSEKLVSDIDTDDIDFVALTKYIKGYLWTGDKHLYKGLKQKNFTRVFNTPEILLRRNK